MKVSKAVEHILKTRYEFSANEFHEMMRELTQKDDATFFDALRRANSQNKCAIARDAENKITRIFSLIYNK